MGLTASPCEEGVLEESQIREKIVELCNNMNSYIECPKNIIEELNKEKKDKIPYFLNDYPFKLIEKEKCVASCSIMERSQKFCISFFNNAIFRFSL